jgi:uncharacterized protein
MRFEWDPHKNDLNKKKHHISFEEAVYVFSDKNALSIFDDEHSDAEERWITLGNIPKGKTILVIHTERIKVDNVFFIRIISARYAVKNEEKQYYNKKGN